MTDEPMDEATDEPLDELAMDPAFLRMLILKVRALMAKEAGEDDERADNPADDDARESLLEMEGDLGRDELVNEIDGLDRDQQNELVALMWIGRGDAEPEEWDDTIALADERREGSTAEYLLGHPELADHWAEALDKLGHGTAILEEGEF